MRRREFLKSTAALGAAGITGGLLAPEAEAARLPGGSVLDLPASSAPIDTIVVLMMENRSFDHYVGWLANDPTYLETGRSLWGSHFRLDGSTDETYPDTSAMLVDTYPLLGSGQPNPHRGCGFGDPGHSWTAGRRQRDDGFLASGSGNDPFALGWFDQGDLPFYDALNRRFTVFDRYHCSLLGPTFPNREYLHSAQSGGVKNNALPNAIGYPNGFTWPTIWDRLVAAGVSCRYYYVDLPVIALWGPRLLPFASPIANYFTDAAAGTLPQVVFLDPGFIGETRTDEHPHGDVRDGQRLAQQYIQAFVESPHWANGVLFLTYDEWGGFFDHVRPARLQDDRRSPIDDENFGQAGFRVPTRMLSPYARRNFVDHRLYDHTSILRFIEWRYLGAPAKGPGRRSDTWYLTRRDRFANNIGWSLHPTASDPDFDATVGTDPATTPPCGGSSIAGSLVAPASDFAALRDSGWIEDQGYQIGNWAPGR